MPARDWSTKQAEVLRLAAERVANADANVEANSRALFVTCSPGTGKTEVVLQCALEAASYTAAVLIACSIGRW